MTEMDNNHCNAKLQSVKVWCEARPSSHVSAVQNMACPWPMYVRCLH